MPNWKRSKIQSFFSANMMLKGNAYWTFLDFGLLHLGCSAGNIIEIFENLEKFEIWGLVVPKHFG